jgi:hypothetical protein
VTGVQPEEDGRLECLECGSWYRLLAPHLAAAHHITSAEYREAHQLPRGLGLRGRDLADRAREQGRDRYAAREDIRAAMADGRPGGTPTVAIRSSQETARRPLVRAARRRGGQGKYVAALLRMDQAAQALGHHDLAAYFLARREATISAMARELGIPRPTVADWRNRLAAGARDSHA